MKTKLRSDQRGIGHLLLVIVAVVIAAVIGLVAWRVSDHNKHSAAGNSAEANCMKVYKDQQLCDFAAANADLATTPYTAQINSVNNMSQTTNITVKSDGKGDQSTSSQNGNQTYNTITIGNTIYVQNVNGGGWIKYAANTPSISGSGLAGSLKAKFSDPNTPDAQRIKYKNLGKTKCDSGTCYKFQITGPTLTGTNYMWVDSNTNRLVQLSSKSSQGTTTYKVTYEPVTITAPTNIVPASSAIDSAQQAEDQASQAQQY